MNKNDGRGDQTPPNEIDTQTIDACKDNKKTFPRKVRARYLNIRGFSIVLPSQPFREAFGGGNTFLEVVYQKGEITLRLTPLLEEKK